jgi:adenosine deaminase
MSIDYCLKALNSLTSSQIKFIQSLPKAELHAHLNGSIPITVLQDLAREYIATSTSSSDSEVVQTGLETLLNGVQLGEIHDFFKLFPAIYALTSTPAALARATRSVLEFFLDGPDPECTYLEIRTTPRATPHMTRREYVEVVLSEVDRFNAGETDSGVCRSKVGLIVSLDRRMGPEVARECLDIAVNLRREGRTVVGVDLCGDPTAGDMQHFTDYFREAKQAGLGVTLHIAETSANTQAETLRLLSVNPDRLGHATFLDEEAKDIVLKNKICLEICLSSNLLCNTVNKLDDHHIRYYLKNNHPIAICTDDPLPFRNSLLGEYALLLAEPPVGLGLSEDEVSRVAKGSLSARFQSYNDS